MAIVVYGHELCPMVVPVRTVLDQAQVPYTYINIHQDPQAAEQVRRINQGNESVPTLVFEDGSTLTEPSTAKLTAKLHSLGYQVASSTQWLAQISVYGILLAGILLGVGIGAWLGDAGTGLLVGTGLGFGVNMLVVRRFGA